MQKTNRRFITEKTARERYGNPSRVTFYRWERAGSIPAAVRINGRKLWDEAELDAHQERLLAERGREAA